MRESPLSRAGELDRLELLRSYHILDSVAEPAFDSVTALAANICGTPMAVLTFLDKKRQWFKSRVGIDLSETPIELAFCAHTVERGEFFEVRDAHDDPVFRDNALVLEDPRIRFYAGAPLRAHTGQVIGSLAVIDNKPNQLNAAQRKMLGQLADHAMLLTEMRRTGWQSTELNRVVTQSSPLPIIVVNRDLKIELWNPAAEQLFGWKSEEVIGRDYPLVPDSERPYYLEMLKQVFDGTPASLREGLRQKKDRTTVRVNVFWAPIRAENGDVIAAMAILQDQTAQLASDRKLQESLSLLSATLESTADGILVIDSNGRIVARNKRFGDIWHLPESVLSSESDEEALAAAQRQLKNPAAFIERVHELYKTPEADSFDVLELNDGRILERFSQAQRINGNIVGRVWSFRDVTERVTLESHLRQSQKMEAIGALAGGIAHDFNNLLNIVIGYDSLLAAELPEQSQLSDYAEKIRHAAERAAGLTRQLLAFSRRQVLRPEVLNVNELIYNLAQMLPRLLPENIEIHLRLCSDPLYVNADPGQLEQVLMNLAVNARDAMPNGGELTISTDVLRAETRSEEPQAQINVSDTGTGIEPEVLPRIFEPFFTTKPIGRGTGLGLSTAYGIIRQSNGTITVRSELGRGTEFTITLPKFAAAKELAQAPRQESAKAGNNEHLLVVEDDAGLRFLIGHILRAAGFQVTEAVSAEHALQIMAIPENKIDLLLTDMMMPRMNGGQLADKALKIRPHLKITFMSGYAEEELRDRCGTATLIEKPFSPEQLIDHVRSMLHSDIDEHRDDAVA